MQGQACIGIIILFFSMSMELVHQSSGYKFVSCKARVTEFWSQCWLYVQNHDTLDVVIWYWNGVPKF